MYTVAITKIADSQQIIAFNKLLFCIIVIGWIWTAKGQRKECSYFTM